MLDADKTGRVSIDNLLAAFQLLSIEVCITLQLLDLLCHI